MIGPPLTTEFFMLITASPEARRYWTTCPFGPQESQLVQQVKASMAAEAEAKALADRACTLLQHQAKDLADATVQKEVNPGLVW